MPANNTSIKVEFEPDPETYDKLDGFFVFSKVDGVGSFEDTDKLWSNQLEKTFAYNIEIPYNHDLIKMEKGEYYGSKQNVKFTIDAVETPYSTISTDGIPFIGDTLSVFIKVTAPAGNSTTYTLNFNRGPVTHEITVNAGANGKIVLDSTPFLIPPVLIQEGKSQDFFIIPDDGYAIEDVLVDGLSVKDQLVKKVYGFPIEYYAYTFTNVTAPHTISATFILDTRPLHDITINCGPGGNVDSESLQIREGESMLFFIIPYGGYVIDNVLVDGASVKSELIDNKYTFINVTTNYTISVTFIENPTPKYNIEVTVGANGSISPSGTVVVLEGTNKKFTITPNDEYVIGDVLVDGVSVKDQLVGNTYTFTNVTTNHTISVTFIKDPRPKHKIEVSHSEGGKISTETVSVREGESKKITITPDEGYEISEVLVDGLSVKDQLINNKYTFTNVSEEHTLEVLFEKVAAATSKKNLTALWVILPLLLIGAGAGLGVGLYFYFKKKKKTQ